VLAILLLQLLTAPLALLAPLPLKIAVDTVLGSRPLPHWLAAILPAALTSSAGVLLVVAASILVATSILGSLQDLVSQLLQTYTGEKLSQDFRSRLFRHVQRLSLSYHDTRGTSDSTFRIQYDAPSIQRVIVDGLIPLCGAATTLVAMIYVTARIDLKLALVALSVSPVLFVLTRAYGPRLRRNWKEIKKLDSSAMGVVQEVLASVRVVKAFGREDREHDRFIEQSSMRVRREIEVAALQGTFDIFVGVVMAAGSAVALVIGVQQVRAGQLSLGNLLLVMAYMQQIYKPLKTLSKKTADVQSSLASAERAFALLDELPEVSERKDARRLTRSAGSLLFLDVSFAYDAEHVVLHRVSFAAPPGTRVGIRGTTGAGKSTLMGLLMRFYDPTDGEITLDGVDLRDYNLADLRRQFAIVLQEPVLFSTSIGENIAYGRDGATREDVVGAARLANAYDFIMELPEGFDTPVGERGMRLSGGERQRISLARAFLKDSPILILDEPTSSVDVKTEAVIMEAMQRLMEGRTTFMIAHRLDTLATCDMQIELEKGWTVFDV
jgi:ATP-binding cassette subfamily B protein